MRHLLAALAFAGVLVLAVAGANAVAARSTQPGVVWLFVRAGGLPRVLASADVRVMAMHGPFLQLYVPSLAAARWPAGSVWGALMLPPAFAIAACG